jgi:hypothetical protein
MNRLSRHFIWPLLTSRCEWLPAATAQASHPPRRRRVSHCTAPRGLDPPNGTSVQLCVSDRRACAQLLPLRGMVSPSRTEGVRQQGAKTHSIYAGDVGNGRHHLNNTFQSSASARTSRPARRFAGSLANYPYLRNRNLGSAWHCLDASVATNTGPCEGGVFFRWP